MSILKHEVCNNYSDLCSHTRRRSEEELGVGHASLRHLESDTQSRSLCTKRQVNPKLENTIHAAFEDVLFSNLAWISKSVSKTGFSC